MIILFTILSIFYANVKCQTLVSSEERYHDLVLKSNPLGYWKLNDTSSGLIENSGNIGNLLNGIPSNVKSSDKGVMPNQQVSEWDVQSSGYIYIPYNEYLDTEELTIEFWMFPTITDTSIFTRGRKSGSQLEQVYEVTYLDGGVIRLSNQGKLVINSPLDSVPLNQWSHLVIGYSTIKSIIYVNGSVVAKIDKSSPNYVFPYTDSVEVGIYVGSNLEDVHGIVSYYSGKLACIALYNSSLLPSTILDHYRMSKEYFGLNGLTTIRAGFSYPLNISISHLPSIEVILNFNGDGIEFSPSFVRFTGNDVALEQSIMFKLVKPKSTAISFRTSGTDSINLETPSVMILSYVPYEYINSTTFYQLNSEIAPNSPSTLLLHKLQYSIHPQLPPGLYINSSTGVISGTPLLTSVFITYTISETNLVTMEKISTQLNISIYDPPPQNLSYIGKQVNRITGIMKLPMEPRSITHNDVFIENYSIYPSVLPNGLMFNNITGDIYGTPGNVIAPTTFIVTAYNSGGSDSIYIVIEVLPTCSSTSGSFFPFQNLEFRSDCTIGVHLENENSMRTLWSINDIHYTQLLSLSQLLCSYEETSLALTKQLHTLLKFSGRPVISNQVFIETIDNDNIKLHQGISNKTEFDMLNATQSYQNWENCSIKARIWMT